MARNCDISKKKGNQKREKRALNSSDDWPKIHRRNNISKK